MPFAGLWALGGVVGTASCSTCACGRLETLTLIGLFGSVSPRAGTGGLVPVRVADPSLIPLAAIVMLGGARGWWRGDAL